ncbi:MAG TPA: hypothetical protein VFM79_08980 [Pelobium sp.]|nr:hypothetical protein [Pelobium sp.]
MRKIFHPYTKWECFKNGMWKDPVKDESEKLFAVAYEFTKDHSRYGQAMKKVVYSWKYSCENFLSDVHINRKAWLGHAACSLELQLPESIVRQAWGKLTDEQRFLANKEAEKYIKHWELLQQLKKQRNQLHLFDEDKNRKIRSQMGKGLLFNRNTGSITGRD